MASVTVSDLRNSLMDAQESCDSDKWNSVLVSNPFFKLIFGLFFGWLLIVPVCVAYVQKHWVLSDLAGKVKSQLNTKDPEIAKVVIQAKNFLVGQGYKFKPKNSLALRSELTTELQPILGDLFKEHDFLDTLLPLWLNVAFAKLNNPNFTITENTLKTLLQRQYLPEEILSSILENQDKIESITLILQTLQGNYALSANELSNLINFQGAVFDALRIRLQQEVEKTFEETLTLSQSVVNQHLPILLELSFTAVERPEFVIDKEGLFTFKPNKNISETELYVIRSLLDKIYVMRDVLSEYKRKYSLSAKQLVHVIESQYKFEMGGTNNPTPGHVVFINTAKEMVNQYVIDHPDFNGDRAKLFNYTVAISTWENCEINIAIIRALMDSCPDRLDALMDIEDKGSGRFIYGFGALERMHRDAVKSAKRER